MQGTITICVYNFWPESSFNTYEMFEKLSFIAAS